MYSWPFGSRAVSNSNWTPGIRSLLSRIVYASQNAQITIEKSMGILRRPKMISDFFIVGSVAGVWLLKKLPHKPSSV